MWMASKTGASQVSHSCHQLACLQDLSSRPMFRVSGRSTNGQKQSAILHASDMRGGPAGWRRAWHGKPDISPW